MDTYKPPILGKGSSDYEEMKRACDSDVFVNIADFIDGSKTKLAKVIDYLTVIDNLAMKLRVLTLPIAEPGALMIVLLTLGPSDATKINRLCMDGFNPVLHFSMYKGMEVPIRLLAHAHADLDVVGLGGSTPLILASENGLPETMKMLINNGAKAYNKCDDSGFAPLHFACQLGNPEMVEVLIKAGANVNLLSSDKLMPIHLAISTAQAASMSPTAPNGIPWSTEGALKCIEILVNNSADLNYVCPYGFSGMSFLRMIGAVK